MERDNVPDKLFAEDTLSYPNSVDGERPADAERRASAPAGNVPDEDMLAVEYREDEVQTASPLEHTPSPGDLYEPGGGNPSPGADIEDEAPSDRGARTS